MHFIVAAFGRDCDDFTLHIYASLAEAERNMISERIKAALARSSKPMGLQNPTMRAPAFRRRLRAAAAVRRAARERAEAYRAHLEWALRQPGVYGTDRPISYRGAANQLNARKIETPRGGRWTGNQVLHMARRLGLRHPLGHLPREVVRARVRALWKKDPQLTVKQLMSPMGPKYPLGETRASKLLRECRLDATRTTRANRSSRPWDLSTRCG